LLKHEVSELGGGVRVVTESLPSVRSVALGFWIGSGAASEAREEAGLSHLLEHLLFRGSERYRSVEIDQTFDTMGAELNAMTGKETTSVYSRVLDGHLEKAFDVISDMVFRPAFEDDETERRVVLEEIAMYEDDPQDRVFDLFGEAVFGDHPLGRAVLGRAEVVRDTPLDAIRAFHAKRYGPSNIVIAAAGSIDHGSLVDLVRGVAPTDGPPRLSEVAPPADLGTPRLRFFRKDTEQVHVVLGAPGIARDDERRYALRVLDTILGGTTSSRLFQAVREERGLAYSVYSFTGQHHGTGSIGIYVGTRPETLAESLSVVADELAKVRESPVDPEELSRAKENAKGRLVLSLESTSARMNRLGGSLLHGLPLLSLDELIEKIDAVDASDVQALAAELLDAERLSVAAIGPDEDAIQASITPLSDQLVVAA
jgi:predicted Zn-dependent peptidase